MECLERAGRGGEGFRMGSPQRVGDSFFWNLELETLWRGQNAEVRGQGKLNGGVRTAGRGAGGAGHKKSADVGGGNG